MHLYFVLLQNVVVFPKLLYCLLNGNAFNRIASTDIPCSIKISIVLDRWGCSSEENQSYIVFYFEGKNKVSERLLLRFQIFSIIYQQPERMLENLE